MNLVALVGRLTKDVELVKTPNGKSVAKFTLACKTRDKTDFISCITWNQSAEYLCKYAKKGTLVSGKGHITTGSYEGNDGKKVYTTEVTLEALTLLSGKPTETPNVETDEFDFPDYPFI